MSLFPVESWRVQARVVDGGIEYRIDGRLVRPNELIQIKGATSNGIQGIAAVDTCRDVIGLAIALHENAARFFKLDVRPAEVGLGSLLRRV